MKNIAFLMTILLSVIIGQVYARASKFKFILHNTSVYKIQITKVCKHNILDPCGSVITLNPGAIKEVIAKQHHHGRGVEVDWQIVKRDQDTKQILCGSSVNWHARSNPDVILRWTFFGEKKRLSDQHKACDAKKITGTALNFEIVRIHNQASLSYYCGETDGHRCYKFSINIG